MIKKKECKKNILIILPIIISVIALLISYFSWQQSKQIFDYEVNKDTVIHTPAIKESIDSTKISFGLNNDIADLQSLKITFPERICNGEMTIATKPIEIHKNNLEILPFQ
jgi:hypothetical protein